MKIYTEISLRDFNFWSGAKDSAEKLTDAQLDQVEACLEDIEPEGGWTDTAINDMFWFEFDSIVQYLGYEDEEHFDAGVSIEDTDSIEDWVDDWLADADAEDIIETAGLKEEELLDEDGEIDEDKLYDAFHDWWNKLSDIEQVKVMRENS